MIGWAARALPASRKRWRNLTEWASVAGLEPPRPGEVQVWRIDLGNDADLAPAREKLLIASEQEHSDRLRDRDAREQFIAGRAALRVLLGGALGLDPMQVPIVRGSHGKPEVALSEAAPLFFNVAHSGRTVLIALTRLSAVGVDIEYLDRETDELGVARHSFAREEIDELARMTDPTQLRAAFFRCWTRKEAIVKADGRGLSLPLSSFAVPINLVGEAGVCVPEPDSPGFRSYTLRDISLGGDIAGALALAPNSEPASVTALRFPSHMLG